MSSIATQPRGEVREAAVFRAYPARFLYPAFAAFLCVLMLVGFQHFYLQGKQANGQDLIPAIKTLLIVHGIATSSWVLLFVVQTLLIASHNRRLHISLGVAGSVLAGCIVVLGVWAAVANAKVEPETVRRVGLNHRQFLAIQFNSMLTFGALVALGVSQRRKLAIHRPLLLLATLAIMGAVTNRIPELRNWWGPTVFGYWFGPYVGPLLLGGLFLALKAAVTRSFDRWFAGGLTGLVVTSALAMQIARTAAWERFAEFLTR